MDTFSNAILGLAFLGLAFAGTFLMYRLWGYPFDTEKLKSTAPRSLILLHHWIGYAYALLYLYFMSQMVPRLWTYEVELPARTVAHFLLGLSIGIILLVKITIVRFFKYLESTMIPLLGTALLMCTVLLVGLSVPFAFKEVQLSRRAAGGTVYSDENIQRVENLLPLAGFSEQAPMKDMATRKGFEKGRNVLLTKCVQCHDLRTVLLRPRTPKNWVQTVQRMSERAIFDPITDEDRWFVSSYLIAISPELQSSVELKREQELSASKAQESAQVIAKASMKIPSGPAPPFSVAMARKTFETTCSFCHSISKVEKSPPGTAKEARELIERMVENGLDATEEELRQILFYLGETYGNKGGQ